MVWKISTLLLSVALKGILVTESNLLQYFQSIKNGLMNHGRMKY